MLASFSFSRICCSIVPNFFNSCLGIEVVVLEVGWSGLSRLDLRGGFPSFLVEGGSLAAFENNRGIIQSRCSCRISFEGRSIIGDTGTGRHERNLWVLMDRDSNSCRSCSSAFRSFIALLRLVKIGRSQAFHSVPWRRISSHSWSIVPTPLRQTSLRNLEEAHLGMWSKEHFNRTLLLWRRRWFLVVFVFRNGM